MTAAYRTIAGEITAEIEVRRSRFVCALSRVGSEPRAREVVAACRREHFDARHHCSAWIVRGAAAPGAQGDAAAPMMIERSSDDGEPAGTAGTPMLEALRTAELQNVVAVVTRWFGGTLLGTGGLARAYGGVTRAAVERARIVRCERRTEFAIALPHAEAGRIESALHAAGVPVVDRCYAERASLSVVTDDEAALRSMLARLTGGEPVLSRVGERWVDCPEGTGRVERSD